MNFIEAYQLIHDKYAGVLANQPKRNSLFLSELLLPDTRQNIINAYKIFIAHVLLYKTRSPEQLDQMYWSTIMHLDTMFVTDEIAKKQEWALTVLTTKSSLYKKLHKKDIELAEIIIKETKFHNEYPAYEELISYYNVMVEYSRQWRERFKARRDNGEEYLKVFGEMQYEYCKYAYEKADVEMRDEDVEYFFSFEILRDVSMNPKLSNIHGKYASYYENCQ